MFELLEQGIESNEREPQLVIKSRADRDDSFGKADWSISWQYEKTIWDSYTIKLNWAEYVRTVDVLNYMDFIKDASGNVTSIRTLQESELYKSYRRMVVHHTLINNDASKTAIEQAKEIRDIQIGTMSFNDIAYHFIIATDWTILEWRPLNRVWSHAGQSIQANSSAMDGSKKLTDVIYDKSTKNWKVNDPQWYKNALWKFDEAMRKDPDYGSLWIALCGNFTWTDRPTKAQLQSLALLMEKYGEKLKIPKENVILHKEVESKVVKASGYTMPSNGNHNHQEHTTCWTNIPIPSTKLKDKKSWWNLWYNKPITL